VTAPQIVAWRVRYWHEDEWQELDPPLDEEAFEKLVAECDDDGADEGTFARGEVRLDDGEVRLFEVEKSYSVDYTLSVVARIVAYRIPNWHPEWARLLDPKTPAEFEKWICQVDHRAISESFGPIVGVVELQGGAVRPFRCFRKVSVEYEFTLGDEGEP
jgi:hypothetical protein